MLQWSTVTIFICSSKSSREETIQKAEHIYFQTCSNQVKANFSYGVSENLAKKM